MWYHGDVTEPLMAAIRADAQRMMGSRSSKRPALPTWTARSWIPVAARTRALAALAMVR